MSAGASVWFKATAVGAVNVVDSAHSLDQPPNRRAPMPVKFSWMVRSALRKNDKCSSSVVGAGWNLGETSAGPTSALATRAANASSNSVR